MDPDLRQRFERLIRELPDWENGPGSSRRTFLRPILRYHPIFESLNLDGSPRDTAANLLDACQSHPGADCTLLRGLREYDREHLPEIDFLLSQLGDCGPLRRRQWDRDPYLGLAYFDRDDAPIFFGRDNELDQLIQTLDKQQGRRFTVVLGASGSGKSSLLRAGLWARLADGDVPSMPRSQDWLISAMTPTDSLGAGPHAALLLSAREAVSKHKSLRDKCNWQRELTAMKDRSVRALTEKLLSHAPADVPWLLILDQMEELFLQPDGPAFLDQLVEATEPPSRLRVVAAIRADLFHHCLDRPRLTEVLNGDGGTFHLGPPSLSSLEQMVSGPIELVDPPPEPPLRTAPDLPQPPKWYLDRELPKAIAADAHSSPGGLALMAFALRELYLTSKATRRMELATYQSPAFGGLSGSIKRKADETLKKLSDQLGPAAAEQALDRVFVRLVRVKPDDPPTRDRERRSVWNADPDALQVIDEFQQARLLVTDRGENHDPIVEVAHEALLREWPRLSDWILRHREAFQLAELVRQEGKSWARSGEKERRWRGDVIDKRRDELRQAGLLDKLLEDADVKRLLTPEADWLLSEIGEAGTTDWRRWEIGDRLAQIGDPRPHIGVRKDDGLPDILFVPIPGGVVEIEKHGSFPVEPFEMAKYPITFSQFRAFLDADDGYEAKRKDWWNGLHKEPRDRVWDCRLDNHPVTNVSWYDATAFCRWLTARLKRPVRLPDEWEWQWAAQSGQAFDYPWGSLKGGEWEAGRANTDESGIRRTTAVGMFPRGENVWKISDLAGNVWEWCRNPYENPADPAPSNEESRVLRGGSWLNYQDLARAAFRFFSHPGSRDCSVGFRVVVAAPIGKR